MELANYTPFLHHLTIFENVTNKITAKLYAL